MGLILLIEIIQFLNLFYLTLVLRISLKTDILHFKMLI